MPMGKIPHSISVTTSLVAVGAPLCDIQEYVGLTSEHRKHRKQPIETSALIPERDLHIIITATVVLRLIPPFLRPLIVWLLPAKWRLEQGFISMVSFVVSEAH